MQSVDRPREPQTRSRCFYALIRNYTHHFHKPFLCHRPVDAETPAPVKRNKVQTYGVKVNHIGKSLTEKWLRSTFSNFGDIESLVLREGSDTGNYAFINYYSQSAAKAAVDEVNGCEVDGVQLQVKIQETEKLRKGNLVSQHETSFVPPTPIGIVKEASCKPASTEGALKQISQMQQGQSLNQHTQHTLKVTNISKTITEAELKNEFDCFKGFVGLKLVNGSPQYAWVNYTDPGGARAAQLEVNNKEVGGCKIKVRMKGESPQVSMPSSRAATSSISREANTQPKHSKELSFALPDVLSTPPSLGSDRPKAMSSIFAPCPTGIAIHTTPPNPAQSTFSLQHLGEPGDKHFQLKAPTADSVVKKQAGGTSLRVPADCHKPLAQGATNTLAKQKTKEMDPSVKEPQISIHQKPFTHALPEHDSSHRRNPSLTRKEKLESRSSIAATDLPKEPQTTSPANDKNRLTQILPKPPVPSASLSKKSVSRAAATPENPFLQAHSLFEMEETQQVTSGKGGLKQHSIKSTIQMSLKLPNALVMQILTSNSKFKSEVDKISKACGVSLEMIESDSTSKILGSVVNVKQAEREISTLACQAHQNITKRSFTLKCMHVPLFATPKTVSDTQDIEKKHCVQLSVVPQSGTPVSIEQFSMSIRSAESDTPVQITKLSEFVSTSHEYIWYADNDDAEPQPLHLSLNNLLNSLYSPSDQKSFEFSHEGKQYVADFSAMILMEKSTGVKRAIRKHPPEWYYYKSEEFGYVPHEGLECKAIENMLQQGGSTILEVEGRQYSIDLDNMVQIDLESGNKLSLSRKPPLNRAKCSKEHSITLWVRGLEESLTPAIADLKVMLERRTTSVSYDLDFPSIETHALALKHLLLNTARQYFVQAEIVQEGGSLKIQIQGVSEYVEKVWLRILKESLLFQGKMLRFQKLPSVPPEWELQESPSELKLVQEGSDEWNGVQDLLRKSLVVAQLKKLERIQNIPLWEKYAFFKQQMHHKNKGETNERLLFHGTRNTSPHEIIKSEKGFDFRFGRNCMWGSAAYFAVNASYSDSYAHQIKGPFGYKQFLLARVLTGHSKELQPDTNLRKPPPKEDGSGDYDTVTGHTSGSQVYMVYDHEKAYPAYLITYLTN